MHFFVSRKGKLIKLLQILCLCLLSTRNGTDTYQGHLIELLVIMELAIQILKNCGLPYYSLCGNKRP